MRVAVGGLMHETNTFARGATTLADFEAYQFAAGDQLFGFRSWGQGLSVPRTAAGAGFLVGGRPGRVCDRLLRREA
jgi:hypothetical protein